MTAVQPATWIPSPDTSAPPPATWIPSPDTSAPPPTPRADIVVFDLETTSADPTEARIVELGIVTRVAGQTTERCWLVNPGVPIPAEATEVHGITNERAAAAPSLGDVLPDVLEALGGHAPLAGYNARDYDGPVLNAEIERLGCRDLFAMAGIVDPLVAIRWHHRGRRFRKLGDVCEFLHVELADAHSAVADARATLEVIDALTDRGDLPREGDGRLAVDEALRLQAAWCERIASEFALWGYWLYADRVTGEIKIGAGKHCDTPLDRMPRGYLRWCLYNIDDLTEATAEVFRGRAG